MTDVVVVGIGLDTTQLSKASAAVSAALAGVKAESTAAAGATTALGTSATGASAGLNSLKLSALGAATAVGGLAVAQAAAGKQFADFGESMGRVGTLLPGQASRVRELGQALLQMEGDADDLSKALFQQISAFGDSSDAVEALGDAYRASVAGGSDMASAVNLTIAATKAFGDTSAEARKKALDLAFVTNKIGVTTFPELAGSMGAVTGVASALGVTIEEVFAGFAALTGTIGNTNDTATALRATYAELLKPTGLLLEAMEDLGHTTGQELIQSTGGFIDALVELDKWAGRNGLQISDLFGNIRALRGVLPLVGSQTEKFRFSLEGMNEAAGAGDTAFQEYTQGMAGLSFEAGRAAEELEKLFIAAGDDSATVLASGFRALADALRDNREELIIIAQIVGGGLLGRLSAGLLTSVSAAGGLATVLRTLAGGPLGAILTVGGAIATVFIANARAAREEVEGLIGDMRELRNIQLGTTTDGISSQIQAINTQIEQAEALISELSQQTIEIGGPSGGRTIFDPKAQEKVLRLDEQIAALEERRNVLAGRYVKLVEDQADAQDEADRLAALEAEREALAKLTEEQIKAAAARQRAIDGIIDGLEEERDALIYNAEELVARKLALLGATPAELAQARAVQYHTQLLESQNDAKETQKEIEQEIAAARAEANAALRDEQARLEAFELDRLRNEAKELSDTLATGLVGAIRGVSDAWTDMIDNMLEQLLRLSIQRSFIDPLLDLANDFLSPGVTSTNPVAPFIASAIPDLPLPGGATLDVPTLINPTDIPVVSDVARGAVIVEATINQQLSFMDGQAADAAADRIAQRAAEQVVETVQNSSAYRSGVRGG